MPCRICKTGAGLHAKISRAASGSTGCFTCIVWLAQLLLNCHCRTLPKAQH